MLEKHKYTTCGLAHHHNTITLIDAGSIKARDIIWQNMEIKLDVCVSA